MRIIERLAQIDRKFAWSFLGVLLSLFGFWYFRDNPARLTIEILTKVRVYDIHEDVPQLAIFFDGENIKEKKEALTFITLKFANVGGKPITQNMYDASIPFGVRLSGGRTFPPKLIDASQEYLKSNVLPELGKSNDVILNKVVFDPGAAFTIRFLVLHSEDKDVLLIPEGKIAGIIFGKMTNVELAPRTTIPEDQWIVALSHNPWIFLVSAIFTAILGSIRVILPRQATLNLRLQRSNLKRTLKREFALFQHQESVYAEPLADITSRHGRLGLSILNLIVINGVGTEKLKSYFTACSNSVLKEKYLTLPEFSHFPETLFIPLIDCDAFTEVEGRMRLRTEFVLTLREFLGFLPSSSASAFRKEFSPDTDSLLG